MFEEESKRQLWKNAYDLTIKALFHRKLWKDGPHVSVPLQLSFDQWLRHAGMVNLNFIRNGLYSVTFVI